MLGGHPVTTKNRYRASLLLKEDDSTVHLERDRRAPLKHLSRIRYGPTHEDGSSRIGIHGQKLSESIASAFQQEGNIVLPYFTPNTHRAYIDAGPDSLRIVQVPSASGWHTQPSLWESDPPTTDAAQAYAEPGAILHSDMRRILEKPVAISPWGVGSPLQPRSLCTESPTATADLARFGKNPILDEILKQLDAVVRWREDWNGEEHVAEKPSEKAIGRAKRVVSELSGAVISKSKPLDTPVISYDYDGYINMVWRNRKHELYLEVNEDEIEYVKVWGANIDSEMDSGVPSRDNYLMLWEWLLDG